MIIDLSQQSSRRTVFRIFSLSQRRSHTVHAAATGVPLVSPFPTRPAEEAASPVAATLAATAMGRLVSPLELGVLECGSSSLSRVAGQPPPVVPVFAEVLGLLAADWATASGVDVPGNRVGQVTGHPGTDLILAEPDCSPKAVPKVGRPLP
jgi:hypothetical protein